jgi:hypothetical protein
MSLAGFENTRDLLGDFLGAKNAGVTSDQEMHSRAGLRVNPFLMIRITISGKRGQLGARPNIVRQRE